MFKQQRILDYCPLCGAMLENHLIDTRRRHDREHHPEHHQLQTGGKDDVE
jgi:hypothetical protein